MDIIEYLSQDKNLLNKLINHYKELEDYKENIQNQIDSLSSILENYMININDNIYEGWYCKLEINHFDCKKKWTNII